MNAGPFRYPVFKPDKSLGFKAIFLALFALSFIFIDHFNAGFHRFRQRAAIIVTPIEYAVNLPIGLSGDLVNDVANLHRLNEDNVKLNNALLLMQAKMQKMLAIQNENAALKHLLQSSTKADGKVLQAQIIAVSPDPYLHQVVIASGLKQGVSVGQPVLDAYGVMGQVVQAGLLTSRVMLVTDSRSNVPVQDSRTGMRFIVKGDDDSAFLSLANVTSTENIKTGDLLVTSGLGQRYPAGYPVGAITSIDSVPGEQFLSVKIKPAAKLSQSELVMLVWPRFTAIDQSVLQGLKHDEKVNAAWRKKAS
jgi:rod shape-determining protein MreC